MLMSPMCIYLGLCSMNSLGDRGADARDMECGFVPEWFL